jgi:glycerol kinase
MEMIITDMSNAKKGGLIKNNEWDDAFLSKVGINEKNLPEIINSSGNYFGDIKTGMLKEVEVTGVIAENQAIC